jgi:hypothetical protein
MKKKTAIYLFAVLLLCTADLASAQIKVTFDSIQLSRCHPKGDGFDEKTVANNGFISGSRMVESGKNARYLMSSRKLKENDLVKLQQLFERIVKQKIKNPETPKQKETGYFSITIWPAKGEAIIQHALGDKPFDIPEFEMIRNIAAAYDVGGW